MRQQGSILETNGIYYLNCVNSGRILDYVIEPASINLPLLHPDTTRLTHVACGRAHLIIATDKEGGASTPYMFLFCRSLDVVSSFF